VFCIVARTEVNYNFLIRNKILKTHVFEIYKNNLFYIFEMVNTKIKRLTLLFILNELFQKLLCNNTSPCVYRQLHLANFLINILHKLNQEVHQLMFEHSLSVEISN